MTQSVQDKLSQINNLAAKAANELGLVLLDVRIGQQGKNKSLEVTVYRHEPAVSFADCEQMSRSLERLIESETGDDSNLLEGPYLLEVSSAGIDRRLTKAFEYNLFAGKKVRVNTKASIKDLGNEFIAVLMGGDEHSVDLAQAAPLTSKNAKAKKAAKGSSLAAPGESIKFNLRLDQIYKIYLWPEAKESSQNIFEEKGEKVGGLL